MDNITHDDAVTACSACMAALGFDPVISWIVAGIGFILLKRGSVIAMEYISKWKAGERGNESK